MDETIDQLKVKWEEVRQRVRALEFSAQFYAERNQQLIDENRELTYLRRVVDKLSDQVDAKDELLWWVTALAWREGPSDEWIHVIAVSREKLQRMLATQGYTREDLEKR